MGFCGPDIFFILLSIISLVLHYNYVNSFTIGMIIHISFVITWSLILYFFCSINWFHFAWGLVVLPFVLEYYALTILIKEAVVDPSVLLQFGTPKPK